MSSSLSKAHSRHRCHSKRLSIHPSSLRVPRWTSFSFSDLSKRFWTLRNVRSLNLRSEGFATRREILILEFGVVFQHLLFKAEAYETWTKYEDPKQRFEISIPLDWPASEKPGAEILFKKAKRNSTNLGITIYPVKISNLDQFGSLEDIGNRLLETERKKAKRLGFSSMNICF